MKIFAANWKLNKNPNQSREFLRQFNLKYSARAEKKIIIFPPATSLQTMLEVEQNTVEFGAQNCYSQGHGAFTGEISAQVVKEMGAQWVLIGHSERREIFKESDEFIAEKIKCANTLGLNIMLCIGETKSQRESHQTEDVLKRQMHSALNGLTLSHLVIAYEPVWSIGTGLVASSDQVREAHALIRSTLDSLGYSKKTPILYGGSVKASNAKELLSVQEVDGFLIGGASLEVDSYLAIVNV